MTHYPKSLTALPDAVRLPARRCQFPLWDNSRPTHEYCGKPSMAESSYCAKHHARCYTGLTVYRKATA